MGLLYTKMKIFHFKNKIDSIPESEDRILPPIHIRIKPTNVCSHNCWYCAYRAENLQLGEDMSLKSFIPREKMLEIIEDIQEMGVKAITLSGGGDPFNYPYLNDMIKAFSNRTISIAALTNGEKLIGEAAELFSQIGSWIRISIDGWDDESYSSYRRVPLGTFSKVFGNMIKFKKLNGKCKLGASLIVDEKNAPHVLDSLRRFKEAGLDSAKVSPCVISNSGIENNKYHQAIFHQVRTQVERAIEELADRHFEILNAYHELEEKFLKDYDWCPYLQILPVIGADLNVYSCQDKAYNLKSGIIGSIRDRRFKEFWLNDKRKFFKINPRRDCNHHCVSNQKNRLILEYLQADIDHLGFV